VLFRSPDTKVVLGVNVRGMIDNPIFGDAVAEIRAKSAGLLAQTPLAGFDPLQDLDEIVIATSGKGEKPPAIVVLKGRFPVEQLSRVATRYHEVPILQSPQQPEGVLALIDSSTVIAGTANEVRQAIDRNAAPANAGALIARAETLRARYGIWGFGDGIEPAASRTSRPGDLSAVDRFEFGLAFDRGLRVSAEIHLRTAEEAEKMAATLRLIEGMINNQKGKRPSKDPGFELRAEKGSLKFSFVIPEAEMKKAIQEERGSLAAALSSRLPALLEKPRANPVVPPGQAFTIEQGGASPSGAPEPKAVANGNGDTVILTLPGKQ